MTANRSIPSLDGLRAGSIALVIVGHSLAYLHGDPVRFPFTQLSELGKSGVDVFFVISGFLITHILLREQQSTGTIRLRSFYFRRFFRIFPPFYAYLLVVAVLSFLGIFPQEARDLVSAGTYTWNYASHSGSWMLGHTWSLSLEEQFYLLWPPCLVLLGKKRSTWLALGLIAVSPGIRVLSYIVAPSLRGNEATLLHTRLDIIMFGCAMALLWDEPRFQNLARRLLLRPWFFVFAIAYIVVISPCLSTAFAAPYDWTLGYTLRGVLVSFVLLYVVKQPDSKPGLVLNLPGVRHVGVISYSLYLWQQMFTGPNAFLAPLNLIAVLACAEASYRLIEIPSFRLRDQIGKTFFASTAANRPVAPQPSDRQESLVQ
jgi:peptidoglycan/LPS O-acetylase OafA/YrhL